MSDERLEAIRERLEAATDGPWKYTPQTAKLFPEHVKADGSHVAETSRPADANLIAHAPTDLRYLLDRIEAQREVVGAARLKRNTLIRDGDRLENGKSFSGEWVAVPREDFDRLRRALDNLEEQTDD